MDVDEGWTGQINIIPYKKLFTLSKPNSSGKENICFDNGNGFVLEMELSSDGNAGSVRCANINF